MTATPASPSSPPPPPASRAFPCRQCGATVHFAPGSTHLRCPYCTTENQIAADAEPVRELDYREALAALERRAEKSTDDVVRCEGCQAQLTIATTVTSFTCPFCGMNTVKVGRDATRLRPSAVLPFKITREAATDAYRSWIRSRWFAPTKLRVQSLLDATLSGVYLPAWTFDADTATSYTGQRGDAYYETRYVTVNGRRQARSVRKVRWSYAAGRVRTDFDDLLVLSSHALAPKRVATLEPWNLPELVPYADAYLAGFRAECYTVSLPEGFTIAQENMQPAIDAAIRANIGGDEQRITSKNTTYSNITFKYILLPVWVSAYRFRGKTYQFLVNARTGEVTGARPYSIWKITLAVLAALAIIAITWLALTRR